MRTLTTLVHRLRFGTSCICLACCCLWVAVPNVVNARQSAESRAMDADSLETQVLTWTTRTGHTLFQYFKALDIAREAVLEQTGQDTLPRLHGAGPYDDGWAFSFGDLDPEDPYVFVITHGVIVKGNGQIANFEVFTSRREASGHHMLTARALQVAQARFKLFKKAQGFNAPAYRFAVLPTGDNELTVFFGPEQTDPDTSYFGQDVAIHIHRTASWITGINRWHHTVIKMPRSVPDGAYTALLVPQSLTLSPFNVALAIERDTPVIVSAKLGAYYIDPKTGVAKLRKDDPRLNQ